MSLVLVLGGADLEGEKRREGSQMRYGLGKKKNTVKGGKKGKFVNTSQAGYLAIKWNAHVPGKEAIKENGLASKWREMWLRRKLLVLL